jgi:hypothetical protein
MLPDDEVDEGGLSSYFEDPELQERFEKKLDEGGIVSAILDDDAGVLVGISKERLEGFLDVANKSPDGKIVLVISNVSKKLDLDTPPLLN